MGINGIETLKKDPMYAHMYRANSGAAPEPGTTAETLCGVEHVVPIASALVGCDVCPNCTEINVSFGGRFTQED